MIYGNTFAMIHGNTFAITIPNWCRIGSYIKWYAPDRTGLNDWVRERIISYGYDGFFHQAHNCPVYFTRFDEYGKTVELEEIEETKGGEDMKLIPISERRTDMRCWFCRTDQSVKYIATMINVNPKSKDRYMRILVCNKCALHHRNDFIDEK